MVTWKARPGVVSARDQQAVHPDTVIGEAHFILKKYKDHGTIMNKKHEDQREIVTA